MAERFVVPTAFNFQLFANKLILTQICTKKNSIII